MRSEDQPKTHHISICERCGERIRPHRLVWLELNCRTGEWAAPGTADWSGGPDSQGAFSFGRDCAARLLREGRT